MAPKCVLLVDDEPLILRTLQRSLRFDKSRWSTATAGSGLEALEILARQTVDVVVTDMCMPGMDGVQLLGHVKDLYPGTARLVLSGYADTESVTRVLPLAHQFLTKPFDNETIRKAIERVADLHLLLTDPALRRVVGRMTHLPAAGSTYAEVSRLAASTTAGAKEISTALAKDPALTAKILQLVNSAFFGVPQRIVTVERAVVQLGLGTVRALALSVQVFGALEQHPRAASLVATFQDRSLRVARLARRLAVDSADADEAFIGGLLHNVGAIMLSMELPQEETRIKTLTREGRPPLQAEMDVLGVTHAELGAYLLGSWGLPLFLVEVAAFHHRPGAITEGSSRIIAAVHVADALTSEEGESSIDRAYLEKVDLLDTLPHWRQLAAEAPAPPTGS
jgi:HD-like signal output (HDOD) protein/CheY-like chemotaxis protein